MIEKKPNFFIVGAEKSGTTSLYDLLNIHKDIFMSPIKEPNHFSKDIKPLDHEHKRIDLDKYFKQEVLPKEHMAYIGDFNQYLKLFNQSGDAKAVGEASVSYLFSKVAAKEIYAFNPHAKIIIILRNPVERALSAYKMDLGIGRIKGSFSEAIKSTPRYLERGLYYNQLKRYFDVFPKENIRVYLFEDLKDSTNMMADLSLFLVLNDEFNIAMEKVSNTSMSPKYEVLNNLIYALGIKSLIGKYFPEKPKKSLQKLYYQKTEIKLDSEEYNRLIKFYSQDIQKLSNLINKDLSTWLKGC